MDKVQRIVGGQLIDMDATEFNPLINKEGKIMMWQQIIKGKPICTFNTNELRITGDGWLSDFIKEHGFAN
jgi:hypothetical protein